MSVLLDQIELTNQENANLVSDNARNFVKLQKLIEFFEAEKERVLMTLSEQEKEAAFTVLQKQFNIPDFITVHDAAEILEVSTQMVRRYCAEDKLSASQRLKGSGKWQIEAKQFMDHKNWNKFVQKRAQIKARSIRLANKMNEILDKDSN